MVVSAINSGDTLYNNDGTNKTSTSLSTNIIIKVNGVSVGAVNKLSISESRSIAMVDAIGVDGHIDSAPNKSTDISGSCDRTRFDRLRIAQAFQRSFIHASAQIYPFDIVIIDAQDVDSGSQILTTIKNVWISDISVNYTSDNFIISDSMNWKAESIFSTVLGGPVGSLGSPRGDYKPALIGNGAVSDIERRVDQGQSGRRGSLDAGGLLSLVGNPSLY